MSRHPLRVCHVMTADLWAGAEVQLAGVARYLAARPDVSLTAVLFNEGWLSGELRRLGVELAVFDEQRYSAFEIVPLIVRFLRDHTVDLVHTHRYKDTILGAAAARLAAGLPVIRTVHGLNEELRGWDRLKLSVYQALERAMLRRIDQLIAVSADTAKRLERRIRTSRVTAIPNAVDLRAVRPALSPDVVRQALGIGSDELIIGTAGRLVPVKGHMFLLNAAAQIRQQEPRARFLFAGSGPLRDRLGEAAEALGIAHACLFVDPAVDRRAGIYDLIAAMDVFVLASIDEGMPMALLEAMALGRPVVASAVGGVPEVVAHRTSGLLVEARNERQIAAACLALTLDRHWAQTLAATARAVVEQGFSPEKNGQALIEVYRRTIRPVRTTSLGSEGTDKRRFKTTGTRQFETLAGRAGALARVRAHARERILDARRRVARAFERRRMSAIRRNPAALNALLQRATTALIVCHGNIIRSPFAAGLLQQLLHGRATLSVVSAGVEARPGAKADPAAMTAASLLGIDLGNHLAAPLTPDLVAAAGVIFVMDAWQLVAMRERFPQACGRTFLLASLCPSAPLEIADPFGRDAARFVACYAEISRAVTAVADAVLARELPAAAP